METLLAIPTMPDLQHMLPAPFGPRGATCTATRDRCGWGVAPPFPTLPNSALTPWQSNTHFRGVRR
eukprot:5143871-Prymnesium_polylepis.1